MSGMPTFMYSADTDRARRSSWTGMLARFVLWIVLLVATVWAFGALWYDFPSKELNQGVAIVYAAVILCFIFFVPGRWLKLALVGGGFVAVLGWWLTLQPSNDRKWQMDVERTPYAEIMGDRVMLHYVRRCDYHTETMYSTAWQTRIVDLRELTGFDIAITYWGSPAMAHPIISFQFKSGPPLCFSIETRKEMGEEYSAIGGFYRQYELAYICAEEQDVIRLRTNFRKGEDVYLYRTTATPAAARQRFMEYITAMNELHERPRWYNAATTNCTTAIRAQHPDAKRAPWDWRMLVNGYMDEMLYEHGVLAGGLPFPELKEKALINKAAKAAREPDFSQRIRAGRPGFEAAPPSKPPRQ